MLFGSFLNLTHTDVFCELFAPLLAAVASVSKRDILPLLAVGCVELSLM